MSPHKTRDEIRAELKGRDPVYGYVRVSTRGQAESGLGLEAQREEIREYASKWGLDADGPVVILEDQGVSGSVPLADREGGRRLALYLAEPWAKNRAHVILRVDRAWRSMYDCMDCLRAWEKAGVALHLVDLPVSTADLMGRKMVIDKAFFGELERGLGVSRTQAASAAAKRNGERWSGSAPWGFRFQKDSRKLVPVPEEFRTLGRLLALDVLVDPLSLNERAELLNREGIPLKVGKGTWSKSRVSKVTRYARNSPHREAFAKAYEGSE
jgi:DNA invertase Pin-like site-specific DNA recombinase